MSFWLTFWTLGVAGLFRKVAQAWRSALHSEKGQIISIGGALFLTAFTIPFLFGESMGFTFLVTFTSISLAIFLLAAAALHILFIYLLKAPTLAGRLMLDRVQGFKMFVGKVEGDRLNRTAPPQQTPEVFEKYLPYALALDVEQDWAEQFSGVLGAAGTVPGSPPAYVPSFYSGSSWNGSSGTNFASSFSSSFTSAISSSSAAPGSSSGSGGGGGGSGGGGGGGGGW